MKIRLGFAQNWLASAILLCITLFRLFPGSSAVEQATVNRLAGGSNPSRGANLLKARSVGRGSSDCFQTINVLEQELVFPWCG